MAALTNVEKHSTLENKEGVVMIVSHRTLSTIFSSISTLIAHSVGVASKSHINGRIWIEGDVEWRISG
ncbi:MAG: hypothetical protein PVI28_11430 [Gammaproteobacteria bacterium]